MLLVAGLAFLGGATVQALPPSSPALSSMMGAPMLGCDDAAMMPDTDGSMPRHGSTPDCVKVMQCLGVPALPEQARLVEARIRYATILHL